MVGFDVTGNEIKQSNALSQLERTEMAINSWVKDRNPYEPLLAFYKSGGKLGRWEQGVLDVWCPGGSKYGIPEIAFKKAL